MSDPEPSPAPPASKSQPTLAANGDHATSLPPTTAEPSPAVTPAPASSVDASDPSSSAANLTASSPASTSDPSSADPSASSHPPPSTDSADEPAAKRQRKRKSLWDQPSADGAASSLNPTAPPAVPMNPLFAHLQSQLALLPQLLSFPGGPHLSASHALSSPTTASRLDRRIYVGSLAYDIPEDTLRVIFEPFGPVAKVDMPKEPGHFPIRSKGFAFVEFDRVDSAKAALMTMNGVPLRGRPMKVGKPTGGAGSEYGSFLSQLLQGGAQTAGALAGQQLNPTAMAAMQAAQIASGGTFNPATLTQMPAFTLPGGLGAAGAGGAERIPGSVGGSTAKTRIYVGSLMWELTEEAVRAIFEPFGSIKSCQLILNPETGKHRGYGFVEYFEEKSAAHAIAEMDGFELIGRKLKVNYASALVAPQNSSQPSQSFNPALLPPGFVIPTLPASMGGGAPAAAPTSLSSEDNLRIHSHEQRASIMQKLSDSGRQSPVLLLKNLVSPSEVDPELNAEVADECAKFGRVKDVKVLPDVAGNVVRVYVVFDTVAECARAVEGLNGRYFDKRAVSAEFYPEVRFHAQIYGDVS